MRKTYKCIGIPKKLETLTTLGSSGTKHITLLTFRFSTQGERERDTHNFCYADCSI